MSSRQFIIGIVTVAFASGVSAIVPYLLYSLTPNPVTAFIAMMGSALVLALIALLVLEYFQNKEQKESQDWDGNPPTT